MNALMKVDQIEGGPYDPGLGSFEERHSFYDRRLGNTRGREGDVQFYRDQLGGGRTFSFSSVAMSPLDIIRNTSMGRDTALIQQDHQGTRGAAHHYQDHQSTRGTAYRHPDHPGTRGTAYLPQDHQGTRGAAYLHQEHQGIKGAAYLHQEHPGTRGATHLQQDHQGKRGAAYLHQDHQGIRGAAYLHRGHRGTGGTAHLHQYHQGTRGTAYPHLVQHGTRGTAYLQQDLQGTRGTAYPHQEHPGTGGTAYFPQEPQGTRGAAPHHPDHQGTRGAAHLHQEHQDHQGTKGAAYLYQDHPGTGGTAYFHQEPQGTRGAATHHQDHQSTRGAAYIHQDHPGVEGGQQLLRGGVEAGQLLQRQRGGDLDHWKGQERDPSLHLQHPSVGGRDRRGPAETVPETAQLLQRQRGGDLDHWKGQERDPSLHLQHPSVGGRDRRGPAETVPETAVAGETTTVFVTGPVAETSPLPFEPSSKTTIDHEARAGGTAAVSEIAGACETTARGIAAVSETVTETTHISTSYESTQEASETAPNQEALAREMIPKVSKNTLIVTVSTIFPVFGTIADTAYFSTVPETVPHKETVSTISPVSGTGVETAYLRAGETAYTSTFSETAHSPCEGSKTAPIPVTVSIVLSKFSETNLIQEASRRALQGTPETARVTDEASEAAPVTRAVYNITSKKSETTLFQETPKRLETSLTEAVSELRTKKDVITGAVSEATLAPTTAKRQEVKKVSMIASLTDTVSLDRALSETAHLPEAVSNVTSNITYKTSERAHLIQESSKIASITDTVSFLDGTLSETAHVPVAVSKVQIRWDTAPVTATVYTTETAIEEIMGVEIAEKVPVVLRTGVKICVIHKVVPAPRRDRESPPQSMTSQRPPTEEGNGLPRMTSPDRVVPVGVTKPPVPGILAVDSGGEKNYSIQEADIISAYSSKATYIPKTDRDSQLKYFNFEDKIRHPSINRMSLTISGLNNISYYLDDILILSEDTERPIYRCLRD